MRFARIEAGVVREIITRPAAFDIARAYHPDLVSGALGGNGGADGFVQVPAGATVKEGYLFDGAVFTAPPPPPASDPAPMTAEDLFRILKKKGQVADADAIGEGVRVPPAKV